MAVAPVVLQCSMAQDLGKGDGTTCLKQRHRAHAVLPSHVVPSQAHQGDCLAHSGQYEPVSKLPQLPNSQQVVNIYNKAETVSNLSPANRELTQLSPGVDSISTSKGLCLQVSAASPGRRLHLGTIIFVNNHCQHYPWPAPPLQRSLFTHVAK